MDVSLRDKEDGVRRSATVSRQSSPALVSDRHYVSAILNYSEDPPTRQALPRLCAPALAGLSSWPAPTFPSLLSHPEGDSDLLKVQLACGTNPPSQAQLFSGVRTEEGSKNQVSVLTWPLLWSHLC